ncbi:MAG: hypothetical protein ACF8CQ_14020 [Rhodopirellula sp. JB044]|uniref:hypothetical protein n=1 Tax=Rhodopirellula sp. JB044 TaxID=3342844 RepID=UPI003709FD6E
MNRPKNQDQLYELFGALANESISPEQMRTLEELLIVDSEARKLYYDYTDVHLELAALEEQHRHLEPLRQLRDELNSVVEDHRTEAPTTPIIASNVGKHIATIAATILATFCLQTAWTSYRNESSDSLVTVLSDETAYFATLLKSVDCEWIGDERPAFDGQRLLSRRLVLKQGVAEFGFDSGVRIVMEGPSDLTIHSVSSALLQHGKIVLHGDEAAEEFSLQTPNSVLYDVGTEYGTEVREDGTTEVHVFSGEVRIEPNGEGKGSFTEQQLSNGQARILDRSGIKVIRPREDKFVRTIPHSLLPTMEPQDELLAYEPFQYETGILGNADGGKGFSTPWRGDLNNPNKSSGRVLSAQSLQSESIDAVTKKGMLEITRDGVCCRTLQTPIRLDTDGVYYISFMLRRTHLSAEGSQLGSFALHSETYTRTSPKIHFGMTSDRYITVSHVPHAIEMVPPRMTSGKVYFYVAKIVAGIEQPDQVMLRVYGDDETVPATEPMVWNCRTPATHDNAILDRIRIHTSGGGRYQFDEIRIGKTWQSVTPTN